MALAFLKTVRINSFAPGAILLSLLFFYDIFWVFLSPYLFGGKSVMVEVATGLDVPIKLEMPRFMSYPISSCGILGLGDIVIPGVFVTFCSRFGEYMQAGVYSTAAHIAYTCALFLCGAMLWIFKTGQPALLYIVPALLGTTVILSKMRGEYNEIKIGIPKQH